MPDNATLRPGSSDFAVTVRYRTTENFGNILQKGQSGGNKGYWKFQQPKGIVSCLFRGADGSKSVNSGVRRSTTGSGTRSAASARRRRSS